MARRLLVPLDGSELSESAIFWAEALAYALGGELELLSVVPHDLVNEGLNAEIAFNHNLSEPEPRDPAVAEGDPDARRLQSVRATLEHARTARDWRVPVHTTIRKGDPAKEIADQAELTDASMVVMTTHARSGPARAFVGSVTDEVINRSRVPVLAIRPGLGPPRRPIGRVLVTLDGSELSEAILPVLTPLAKELSCSVVLFSLAELPPPTIPVQGAAIPLGPSPAIPPAEIMDHLDRAAAQVGRAGVQVETRVADGRHPADAIMQAAAESDADLIAMSTHGRRGLNRWVRGSVTDAVLHHAEVPILVVRPSHGIPDHGAERGQGSA
jgi:nucleotide-binding universal stress UspA family protein